MNEKETLKMWKEISALIAEEISQNREFAQKLGGILCGAPANDAPKKRNRRAPAKLDPFALLESGEDVLSNELAKLNVDELKDIVSEYGLDTSRLALKWKDRQRLETLIIDSTKRKASHGDAFWNSQRAADDKNLSS